MPQTRVWPKGILHDHCLSLGRGGGRPIRARSEGGSSAPPWKRREAGGVGGHSVPGGAVYDTHQRIVVLQETLIISESDTVAKMLRAPIGLADWLPIGWGYYY